MAQANTVDGMAVDEEDEESLFGSPPPTPIRGRSPSPILALPSASSSVQNVGTIALPGSHPYSELPINPLASSSYPNMGQLPRPPALSQTSQGSNPDITRMHVSSPSSCHSWSRASSAGPSVRPIKKVPKKPKSKESTPRPPGPEIALPDPSNPPPANFLRNQVALLGTAGLVGGVKPANLSVNRYTRGTNPANPIVVEDEDEPTLGRGSKFRHPYAHPIDPSLLPTPSTQDVVAMLIGQKDIFPVLESILRLIASGAGPHASHPSASSRPSRPVSSETFPPPTKKRKLSRVPAGAVDWDVPYPFPQGEGPEAYRTTWERERGKQLISQLVSLIKNAARKAATKLFIQNQETYKRMQEMASHSYGEAKIHGHYRPSTVMYGLEGKAALTAKVQVQDALTDASNGRSAMITTPSPYQPAPLDPSSKSGPQLSTPFDQLISSLLAASSEKVAPGTEGLEGDLLAAANPDNTNTILPENTGSGETATSIDGNGDPVDQGLLDSWMNILQTFPVPSEGFVPPANSTRSSVSTFSDSDTFDLSDFGNGLDFDLSPPSAIASDCQSQAGSLPPLTQPNQFSVDLSWDILNLTGSNIPINDHPTDPTLMALSGLQHAQLKHSCAAMSPPPLAPSPMPSMSSFGEADPMTPNSAQWDMSMPDIFTGTKDSEVFGEGGIELNRVFGGLGGQGETDEVFDTVFRSQEKRAEIRGLDKGKKKDIGVSGSVVKPAQSQPVTQDQYQAILAGLVTSTSLLKTAPSRTLSLTEKARNKADILRRARERRQRLMTEIDRVKTQLWETTIEQGALAHLNKIYS